ncbi:MAG: exodeoxyribonuclease VII large subunit [Spirochaetales bacterium]
MAPLRPQAVSVAEITRLIKSELEDRFPLVAVEGELSNVRPSSTGHVYFTLKDEDASISAVLFRGRASGVPFVPEDGQQVVVYGSVGVYAKRGTYQIIVERMELAGEGRILAMLEQRKRALAAEGLFDEDRKRRIPALPNRVVVVTSPTGAALRDIMQVLRRRNAGVSVVICPSPVQGDEAGARIARMIEIASTHRLGDVMIVTRGGGSIEDLLPFSEESVVRAIAASAIPVISAVGHEIDWALSDFAADVRAPTPSAAAELVSANRLEVAEWIRQTGRSIVASFLERYQSSKLLLRQFSSQELYRSYLLLAQPTLQEFDRLKDDIRLAMKERLEAVSHRFRLVEDRLKTLSPYQILERGYAIARNESGKVIRRADAAKPGTLLHLQLYQGSLLTRVEQQQDEESHEKLRRTPAATRRD